MAENLVKYKVRAKIDGRDVEITLSAPEGTSEDELRATIQNVTPEELTSLMTSQEVVGPPEPVPEREPGILPDQYTFGIPQLRHDLRTGRSAEKWGPETRTPPSEHEPEYRMQTDDPNLTHGPTPMRPQPLATRAVPSEGWQFLTNQPFMTGLAEGASLGTLGHVAGLKGGIQNVGKKLLTEFPPIAAKTEPGAIQFETPAAKYLRELGEGLSEGYRSGRDTFKKPIKDNPIRGTLGEVASAFIGGYPLASVGRHAMTQGPRIAEKFSDMLGLPKKLEKMPKMEKNLSKEEKKAKLEELQKTLVERSPAEVLKLAGHGLRNVLTSTGRGARWLPRSAQDTIAGATEGAIASALMGDMGSMGTNAELGGLIGGGTALLSRPLQDAAGKVMTLFQSPASRSAQTLRDALRFAESGEQIPPKKLEDAGIPQIVLRRGMDKTPLKPDEKFHPRLDVLTTISSGDTPAITSRAFRSFASPVDTEPELRNLLHDSLGYPGSGREFAREQLVKRQQGQGERFAGLTDYPEPEISIKTQDEADLYSDAFEQGRKFLSEKDPNAKIMNDLLVDPDDNKALIEHFAYKAGARDRIREIVDTSRNESGILRHFDTPIAERNLERVFGPATKPFLQHERAMTDTYDELRKVLGSSSYRMEPGREHIGFAVGRDVLMPTQYSRYALGHALAKGGRDERKRATYDRIARMLTQRVPIVDPRWKPPHPDKRKKPLKYMYGDFMKWLGPKSSPGDPPYLDFPDKFARIPQQSGEQAEITYGPLAVPGMYRTPLGYSGNPLETFIPPSETLYRHSSGGAGMLFNPLWRDAEGLPISETRAINRFVVPAALAGAGYPGAARIWTLGRVMKRAADAESDESGE